MRSDIHCGIKLNIHLVSYWELTCQAAGIEVHRLMLANGEC